MAESGPGKGVVYTCPDDFFDRVPSLMARAGIALKELPPPEDGEGCERSFALQMSRDKGTVELSGFYFVEEKRFVMGFGFGRNPLRWFRDGKLSVVVYELLTEAGMTPCSTKPGEDSESSSPDV